MSTQQKKTVNERKLMAKTPAVFSNRGTFGGTTRKTISRSKSFTSVSTSMMSILSEENELTSPLEREMELYNEEWCTYMVRVLQSKMLSENEMEREAEARKCLVSLKKEYEDVLAENSLIYEKVRKMEIFEKGYRKLEEILSKARNLLKTLREKDFGESLTKINGKLEENANRLKLVRVTRDEIDEAFSKNVFGFNSDIYKLLKIIEDHAADQRVLLPEIFDILKEIRFIHAENEELKIRCTARADELRRKKIVSDYEKYFKMAVEECREMLEKLPEKKIKNCLADDSLPQRTIEWGDPTSSSTPTACAALHRPETVPINPDLINL